MHAHFAPVNTPLLQVAKPIANITEVSDTAHTDANRHPSTRPLQAAPSPRYPTIIARHAPKTNASTPTLQFAKLHHSCPQLCLLQPLAPNNLTYSYNIPEKLIKAQNTTLIINAEKHIHKQQPHPNGQAKLPDESHHDPPFRIVPYRQRTVLFTTAHTKSLILVPYL